MSLLVAKVVSMFGLGLVTWLVGVLPLLGVRKGWLKDSETQQTQRMINLFSVLLCFGGGVILTSCLTHMLPDVNEVFISAVNSNSFPDSGLPVPEILVLAGFLMIYFLEELLHNLLERTGALAAGNVKTEGHGHSHGDAVDVEQTEASVQVMNLPILSVASRVKFYFQIK